MAINIHPTAIIDPTARLGEGVEIGPSAIIEAGVTIGDRTKIGPMVHIQGTTEIGPDNVIGTGAQIGFPPQFLGFNGAPTRTVIGARNVIREYAGIHRAIHDEGATTIGDDCFLMAFSHVAHDCHIGNRVIIANGALVAGHVEVGDRAFISGNVVIHQFCRIGRLAMLGGLARVSDDCPPFTMIEGIPARIRGLNVVGLRRAGVSGTERMEIKRLLRQIYAPGKTLADSLAAVGGEGLSPAGRELLDFYRNRGKRGITPFSLGRGAAEEAEEND